MEKVTGKTPGKFQAAARAYQQSDQLYQDASCRFWRCRRDFWRQSCRKENRARSAARWNTRLPAVWRQSRSGRNRWKRCVPGGMMPIRMQRTAAEACQEAQISLEHESRRRIEIQGKLYGQNQDSPAAQPDADALEKELRQMAQEIRRCRQAEITYTDRIAMEERSGRTGGERSRTEEAGSCAGA